MERLNFNQLFYFNTIAHEGSYAKAAHKLEVSASTLSEQMKSLSNNVGFELFEKEGNTARLTTRGLQLYEFTRRMFTFSERINRFLLPEATEKKVLTIGIASSISRAFTSWYLKELISDGSVLFRSQIGGHEILLRELYQMQIDILITDTDMSDHHKNEIESTVVTASPWLVVTGSSRVDLAEKYKNREVGLPFIMHPPASTYRWLSDQFLEDLGILPDVIAEIDDTQLILKAIADGSGLAILPQIMVNGDLESKKLVKVDTLSNYTAKVYVASLSRKAQDHVHKAIELLKNPKFSY